MTKKENEIVTPMTEAVGSTFQSLLEEEGICEEVNEIASQRVSDWQKSQPDAAQIEDTPLTEEEKPSSAACLQNSSMNSIGELSLLSLALEFRSMSSVADAWSAGLQLSKLIRV